MDSKGYYKTLGISENATEDEIKKSFRKLSIKFHPDKQANKSDKEKKDAEAKFKEINEAYQVLSDPEKRKKYDQGGSFSFDGSGFDMGDMGGFNMQDFADAFGGYGFSGFGDLFGNPYNNTFNNRQRQPERGQDIKMTIPITLEDVFNGVTKKVKYQRNVRCPVCHGEGGTGKHTCPDCNGSGIKKVRSRSPFGYTETITTCQRCGGTGQVVQNKCTHCGGTGYIKEETIIEVKFMPGMYDGYSIQYSGKGSESKNVKGENGDFYAVCKHVYDQERYMINNSIDIYEKIEIPYYDALLGCEYILEKPDHKKIKVNIPSCIQNGKHLKLANEGLPGGGHIKGDYYLIVFYKIPDKLSWRERNALEALKLDLNKDNNK